MDQVRSTRPGKKTTLRIFNFRKDAVDVNWIAYDGSRQKYNTLKPYQCHSQRTFSTHYWVLTVHGTQLDILYHVGESATVLLCDNRATEAYILDAAGFETDKKGEFNEEICLPHISCPKHSVSAVKKDDQLQGLIHVLPSVLVPLIRFYAPLPPLTDVGGRYCQRDCIKGIPICAHDIVCNDAVRITRETLGHMLHDVDNAIVDAMQDAGLEIAIISSQLLTCDIPAHLYLKGCYTQDGRLYDLGTRGLGATMSCPVMSVGEENILMRGDTKYRKESILVHEFAHAVMNVGLRDTTLFDEIQEAYENACIHSLYKAGTYVISNSEEYWAEMTQAWFHATIRTDVTSGVKTRQQLYRRDPILAAIMARVWGDGQWRFLDTSPCSHFGVGEPRCAQNLEKIKREKVKSVGENASFVSPGAFFFQKLASRLKDGVSNLCGKMQP